VAVVVAPGGRIPVADAADTGNAVLVRDPVGEVGVGVVDARVDDGDDDLRAPTRDRVRLRSLDLAGVPLTRPAYRGRPRDEERIRVDDRLIGKVTRNGSARGPAEGESRCRSHSGEYKPYYGYR
jgi:hypothetical protein